MEHVGFCTPPPSNRMEIVSAQLPVQLEPNGLSDGLPRQHQTVIERGPMPRQRETIGSALVRPPLMTPVGMATEVVRTVSGPLVPERGRM
jgi:hypothetical protein